MAEALVARGHSVTVFSESPKPSDATYQHEQTHTSPPLRSLKSSWHLRKADWSRFDVLHAHGDDWFLWGRDVPPHVRTVHGSCLAEAANIPGLKNKLYMLWLAGLETLSCLAADKVVGVSQNTCRSYPWIKAVIPNGVNLAAFSGEVDASMTSDRGPVARKHETPEESAAPTALVTGHRSLATKSAVPSILFVGTYANRKRGKLLMDIFKSRIRPALPEAQLWMVCSDAPAAAGVTVFGRIPEAKLIDLYRRAWVFCLPSTYEGFGIPYIEAMAAGTAVVASPNVGALEVTRSGQDGLVPKDDTLAETLLMVLTNSQERQRLEAAGLARVKDFDLNTVCERYEQIYEGLIGHK